MQLVAYGAQDVYLTGNPQITFFKVVYRRHTNFSMESIKQVWIGGDNVSGHMTSILSRNGDLINGLHIQMDYTVGKNDVLNFGYTVIDNVECEIGGQMIDRQTGEWMELYSELTDDGGNSVGSATSAFSLMSFCGGRSSESTFNYRKHIPLRFWFCRNPGLALPLIALQYHEVKINLTFLDNLSDFGTILKNDLYADYIYLDTDERRRFAQVSHEYLIEQVQTREFCNVMCNIDLDFNHPVKELYWNVSRRNKLGYSPSLPGLTEVDKFNNDITYQIKLNGHDRFSERPLEYFTQFQIWRHHSGNQMGFLDTDATQNLAVYSFALKPEEHQPSGTCNFSRIDNAQLIINGNTTKVDQINVFAINYNVLRVMSGMGGLAYSN